MTWRITPHCMGKQEWFLNGLIDSTTECHPLTESGGVSSGGGKGLNGTLKNLNPVDSTKATKTTTICQPWFNQWLEKTMPEWKWIILPFIPTCEEIGWTITVPTQNTRQRKNKSSSATGSVLLYYHLSNDRYLLRKPPPPPTTDFTALRPPGPNIAPSPPVHIRYLSALNNHIISTI